jgi:hypothetical protein
MPENADAKQSGRFRKGVSGNPGGKPRGCRHKATRAAEMLLQGEAEELTRLCVERAKAGDGIALRLVMERIYPPIRERAIRMSLPRVESVLHLPAALGRVMVAVSAGEITPGEGYALCGMLGSMRQAFETADLAARLDAMETRIAQGARDD